MILYHTCLIMSYLYQLLGRDGLWKQSWELKCQGKEPVVVSCSRQPATRMDWMVSDVREEPAWKEMWKPHLDRNWHGEIWVTSGHGTGCRLEVPWRWAAMTAAGQCRMETIAAVLEEEGGLIRMSHSNWEPIETTRCLFDNYEPVFLPKDLIGNIFTWLSYFPLPVQA